MTDLEGLRQRGEDQTIEFKQSFAEQGEIIETLVAFANAQGGDVYVGIGPSPLHKIVGASIGATTLEEFAVRLRDKAGTLPGFNQKILIDSDKKIVRFSVSRHKPGQFFLSSGIAWIRVGNTNQRMLAEQIRSRILDDPELLAGRPRFQISSPSIRNAKDEPYIKLARVLDLIDGEFIESVAWRFRGPSVSPPMEWQRSKIEAVSGRRRTNLQSCISKNNPASEDDEIPFGQFAIELKFRWRGAVWHQLHRFPISGWEIEAEILPSSYKREDGDWIDSS